MVVILVPLLIDLVGSFIDGDKWFEEMDKPVGQSIIKQEPASGPVIE
jgi:hypothetical protein